MEFFKGSQHEVLLVLGHPWGFTGKGPSWPFDVFAKGPKNNNLKFQSKNARTFGMLGVHFRHTYAKSECM